MIATKSITPATRGENVARTGYVVALRGQPSGTVRTKLLTLTDTRPTFWNAFDLASFPAQTVSPPVNQVRLDVLVGVTYQLQGDDPRRAVQRQRRPDGVLADRGLDQHGRRASGRRHCPPA